MNFSFPKENRLITKSDFNSLRNDSARLKSGFVVFIYKYNSLGCSRLGLAVSKKFGNAVNRNKMKRITREKFRVLPFVKPIDVLVTIDQRAWAKRDKKIDNFIQIKNDLDSAFSKLLNA